MKKTLLSFLLLLSLIFTIPKPSEIYAQSENKEVEVMEESKEVQNFSETQGFPDTCKIPVSLYLAIFLMSVGVVIYVK